MNFTDQRKAARDFAYEWGRNEVSERSGYQLFWIELLQNVLGDTNASKRIKPEEKVKVDNHENFIDIYLPDVKVLIEQKKRGIKLDVASKQSDGSCLTPFQQAKKYNDDLRANEKALYIITSNFDEIWVYDMNPKVRGVYEPVKILLLEIFKNIDYLKNILVKKLSSKIEVEEEISFKAGSIIGKIYNALYKQYEKVFNPLTEEILRDLNKLCVRLVFCFYAEDTDLFPEYNYFQHYMDKISSEKFRKELIDVFETLDTDYTSRDEFIEKALNDFPYVNGGLFEGKIKIPQFDDELKAIIHEASVLHWENISPAIFGAMFESTLNPDTRRTGGMHYTTVENIHKVIDPLFLDDLRQEFEKIKSIKAEKQRKPKLLDFQDKIASLKFLDPACGSGNFLTETYISLRRLENEILKELNKTQRVFGTKGFLQIKVSINQFYGIEINDFAVDVAKAAMWIAENQMLHETLENIALVEAKPLPLNTNDNIVEANALRIDWESVVPKSELNYIMGNPPRRGTTYQTNDQKDDIKKICPNSNIDYVVCWYYKAVKYIVKTPIRCAFVSTSSITQGEQVTAVWKYIYDNYKAFEIDFAYREFKWDSEASIKAQVYCVVIGFSCDSKKSPLIKGNGCDSNQGDFQENNEKQEKISLSAKADIPLYERGSLRKRLYENGKVTFVSQINPYLIEGDIVFIESRKKPIQQETPILQNGGKPTEGGFLILTEEEKNNIIKKNPLAIKYIRPYMMGKDFIERKPRYCIWLVNADPSEIKKCSELIERIGKVREYRLKSPKLATKRKADTPMLFDEVRECDSDYVAIPKVSGGRRRYIPMDFLPKEIIPGDKLFMIQNSNLYIFGVLMSKVHMSWMRLTASYLSTSYSYSNTIVYNNFPFPTPTDKQKENIEQTAKFILDIRANFPKASLAALYDLETMPPVLLKAHEANDKAVMQAYGLPKNATEAEIVAYLMNLYKQLTKK